MKIKLGFIGTNFVSDWMADAANSCQSFELAAVMSRTKEKGSEFAKRHNIPTIYTSLDDFLSSDIDAVYVATPNCFHFEQTISALNCGKHVICEKPIASNLSEFEAMVSIANEKNLILLEAMRPAYDPALDAVKKALSEIGFIRRASLEFCQYSSRYDKYCEGEILRTFNPSFSNAAAMDIGVYPIHFCLRLFGMPSGRIHSCSVMLPNGFEGSGTVILPYDGMTVSVCYSKICDSVTPSVITGEKGSITIDKISCPSKIELIMRNGMHKAIEFDYRPNNMIFELEEFARLINLGDSEHEHNSFSRMELRILDEIRRQNNIVFPADASSINHI